MAMEEAVAEVNPWKFWGSALACAVILLMAFIAITMHNSKYAGELCLKDHPKYTKRWHQCVDDYVKGVRTPSP